MCFGQRYFDSQVHPRLKDTDLGIQSSLKLGPSENGDKQVLRCGEVVISV